MDVPVVVEAEPGEADVAGPDDGGATGTGGVGGGAGGGPALTWGTSLASSARARSSSIVGKRDDPGARARPGVGSAAGNGHMSLPTLGSTGPSPSCRRISVLLLGSTGQIMTLTRSRTPRSVRRIVPTRAELPALASAQ